MRLSLRALRINYNLSAKKVAEDLGMHYQTILKYENDSTSIPNDVLEKFCAYYKIKKDDIFLGNRYEINRNNTILKGE